MPPYTPLWCKSNFSFLEGASHPEEIVETASRYGLESIALTDRDGVYGIVEAHAKARELGILLIIGAEVTVEDKSTIVLLAMDRTGYANLCHLLTRGRRRSDKGESVVSWNEVCAHSAGVIALWGGARSLLVDFSEPAVVAQALREVFGDRLYAMLTRHHRANEVQEESRLRARAEAYGLPVVAAVEVLYHRSARRDLQDVLTCIRHGVPLAGAGSLTQPNAEHGLKTLHAFEKLFSDDPEAVRRTCEVASRCNFSLDDIRYRYPAEKLPDGSSSSEWLRQLTFQGAAERFRGAATEEPSKTPKDKIPQAMLTQLEKELSLIVDLDYCGYFLTMWEIVRFCHEHGILCQGRGSAANSAVCYCLGITSVDPVRMGLLFERFLSRERAEPPDIDLDIEHNRREEVIQHVYQKYGRTHSAMVANFIRYRTRSAVRDVGKVLGLAETALDRLAKRLSTYSEIDPVVLADAGLDPNLDVHHHLLRLTSDLLDFPRHLSIHPGGFLLGHEPVSSLVPIENASMPERTVIQWDKDSIEKLGLFKVDLLGLGSLTQLHLGFDLLRKHYDIECNMANIPSKDQATFDMICRGDTVGVFQIESRAQMAMLPRLKPQSYYDLVIEVSIVRPGPITGGMVHPYLRRRAGEEPVVYPHLSLEPVLKKTLGVPLFQEQVIRLAMVAANYTPGEADQLRRDMAAWRKTGRIERHRERLVQRMMSKGIEREFSERVFEQIRGFGEYGFPESHAASFALIAYAGAWMKRHYPDVFTCSLLNALPMGFYSPATLIGDAKRHDVEVRPVDALCSDWDCTLEAPTSATSASRRHAIRLGFRFIKGLRHTDWQRVERARNAHTFSSPEDFAERSGLNDRTLTRLAEAGVLSSLEKNRRNAIWTVKGRARLDPLALQIPLLETRPEFEDLNVIEDVTWDYDTMGLSSRTHPLFPLRDELTARGLPDAKTLNALPDGRTVQYAGLVICRQRPGTASGVVFMTLEDETGFVNLVVWSKVFKKNAVVAKTANFLGVTGKLQVKDEITHLIAERFWVPKMKLPPERIQSRDFR